MRNQFKTTVRSIFQFSEKILFFAGFLLLFQVFLSCDPQNKTSVDVREEIVTIPTQEITASSPKENFSTSLEKVNN